MPPRLAPGVRPSPGAAPNQASPMFAGSDGPVRAGPARISHAMRIRLQALSLTPRFSGVSRRSSDPNRFSGFLRPVETAKAVQALRQRAITPLKRGVNERMTIQGRAGHEISGPAAAQERRAPVGDARRSMALTECPRARALAAFTLPEVMIASGLALVVLLALALFSVFSGRSFVAIANYVNMDQHSQLALDKMSREIREAHRLTAYSPTSLTFLDADNNPVTFTYAPEARTLLRISDGQTNSYLTDCDSLQFGNYQRTTISNTFDAYAPAFVTNTKLVRVTWVCSRQILGAKANTESVQSAKIVIRNN